jgi:hypothetical protein
MAKPCRRYGPNGTGTLIFGIVFTVVGGGLLIERSTGVDVWGYIWRLWPVLLIVMGVKSLLDCYAARASARKGQP